MRAAGYSTLVVLMALSLAPVEAEVRVPALWRWVTDAPVIASAAAGDVAYLGGRFRYIAAVTPEGPGFVDQSTINIGGLKTSHITPDCG